jgi:predicted nucleic acid-binding protein
MPPRAVCDSTILVSPFLMPGGAADAVLRGGINDRFTCCLADEIIDEMTRRLRSPRL